MQIRISNILNTFLMKKKKNIIDSSILITN